MQYNLLLGQSGYRFKRLIGSIKNPRNVLKFIFFSYFFIAKNNISIYKLEGEYEYYLA